MAYSAITKSLKISTTIYINSEGEKMSQIIEITDFNAKELDVYARLTEAELLHLYEPKGGIFIAESPKVIRRALDAGYEPISLLLERKHIETQMKDIIARCPDIPVFTSDSAVLTQLTGYSLARGALCAMKRPERPDFSEIIRKAKRVAVMENIMNSTNIGAIFRSAAALDMDAVLLTPDCSDPLYRRAVRVSMGTVFQIPWSFLPTNENYVSVLQEYGFKTAAMALTDNSVSIDDKNVAKEERLAIILGTEGEGLKQSTIDKSDYTVKIPMSHGVDSLNVAAASAVAFWQLGKR